MSAPDERREIVAMTSAAALLVAQQVAAKATRDALFLASHAPRELPLVIAIGAVLSIAAVIAMARILALRGPHRAMPAALIVNGALYAAEWSQLAAHGEAVAYALYLHVAAIGAVLISGFWSVVRERSDPHGAKTFVARVTAGATFGGILGGLATTAVTRWIEPGAMFLVLAGTNVAVALLVASIAPPARLSDPTPRGSAATAIAGSGYLRAIALLAATIAVIETLIEFAFNAAAAHGLRDAASLAAFFSLFYTATNTLTFGLQTVLGRAILRRFGLGAALSTLPSVVALGLGLLAGAPFAAIVALRGATLSIANSIHRSGYEILFVPLPSSVARTAKTWVDVGGARLGDLAGAGLITLMLVRMPETSPLPAVVAGALALASLVLVRALTRGYVQQLQSALGTGTVELGERATLDATTRHTLEDGSALDRATILRAIDEKRRKELAAGAHVTTISAEIGHDRASRFHALTKGTVPEARAALRMGLDAELARAAIPHLASPELAADALQALRGVVSIATGTVADALLDPEVPLEVRARVPRVLRAAASHRAVAALALGLEDASLEIRLHCARALARLHEGSPSLAPPESVVLSAAMRELARHGIAWSDTARPSSPEIDDDERTSIDDLVRARASRSLELVLTLLSIVVDRESMRLALSGLVSGDALTRATAVELLENVAPAQIREPLVSALVGRRTEIASRSREQIVEDLLRSQAAHARKP